MSRGRNSWGQNKEPMAEKTSNMYTAFGGLSKVFFQVISVKKKYNFRLSFLDISGNSPENV